jgi:sortase (surface protein transpeptidase)
VDDVDGGSAVNDQDADFVSDGGTAAQPTGGATAKKATAKKATTKKAAAKKATTKKAAAKKATTKKAAAKKATTKKAPVTEVAPAVEAVDVDLDAVLERVEGVSPPTATTTALGTESSLRPPSASDEPGPDRTGSSGPAWGPAVAAGQVAAMLRSRTDRLRHGVGRLTETVGARQLGVGGAVLAALVVLGVLGARLSMSDDGAQVDAGAAPGEAPASNALRIAFPEPGPDTIGPEDRLRPVGVRSLEVGFEVAVVSVTDVPSCSVQDGTSERALWFDASGSELDAVAPGEHGVAVLLAAAGSGTESAPFLGLGGIRIGAIVEVARSNATVLAWRVIDVVRVAPGTAFPVEVLAPAAEQRLVLVGCGADDDGAAGDIYVLALRAG